MRLKTLKLAGFKSFVDPTTLTFRSDLVGVVGPNGCGKSNIIDAVRWVLGESSAKQLRGESLTDVIFNGSSSRKPVGQAAVELIFDNSDGGLIGQYASYAEISVKRTVSRDGVSVYYLNGVRCRRKDITHLFLGTGLGPRSYAIIEQGMISRIIESRPEELRVYIEEAAGISKYKDRRRETENRLSHTRDNLDRVNDVLQELERQLLTLKKQSEAAEKYRSLKQQERTLQAQWLAIRWSALHSVIRQQTDEITALQSSVDAELAKLRKTEADIEAGRLRQQQVSDELNQAQREFYEVGSEIARTEQSIQHAQERQAQVLAEQARLAENIRTNESEINTAQTQLEELQAQLETLTESIDEAESDLYRREDAMRAAELAQHTVREDWDRMTQMLADAQHTEKMEAQNIRQFEERLRQLAVQRDRARQALDELKADVSTEGLATLDEDLGELDEQLLELDSVSETLAGQQQALSEQLTVVDQELKIVRDDKQRSFGQLAAEEARQAEATSATEQATVDWLNAQGLNAQPRLLQDIDVEPGWEAAVEAVLNYDLQAIALDRLTGVERALKDFRYTRMTFVEPCTSRESGDNQHRAVRLCDKVAGRCLPDGVLDGIYAVNTLDEALVLRDQIDGAESVVTRDGIQIGKNWIRAGVNPQLTGVLDRESQIQRLQTAIEALSESEHQLTKTAEDLHRESDLLNQQARNVELNQQAARREQSAKLAERSAMIERQTANQRRIEQFERDSLTIDETIEDVSVDLETAELNQETALSAVAERVSQREQLQQQRDDMVQRESAAREALMTAKDAVNALMIKRQSLDSERSHGEQTLRRLQSQLADWVARRTRLAQQADDDSEPLESLNAALQSGLARRTVVEQRLAQLRNDNDAEDAEIRAMEQLRHQHEKAIEAARDAHQQAQLILQENRVRADSLTDQASQLQIDLLEQSTAVDPELDETTCKQQLDGVTNALTRLGSVNLMAIDEYKAVSERKVYLDEQCEDLNEALRTLEASIKKIDRESRTRFKETFDQINAGIKDLFPKLFGGGYANLELVGDDLLSTGVAIMARPPGKRNTTIHQLSGGEKSLTAIALVFAIFKLNPSPFCMLDEVDAPLDDANVGRYGELVREMASDVQFIVVTHNKATMEMAHQLAGVTMSEPGVSRVVAVDLDEALGYVDGTGSESAAV